MKSRARNASTNAPHNVIEAKRTLLSHRSVLNEPRITETRFPSQSQLLTRTQSEKPNLSHPLTRKISMWLGSHCRLKPRECNPHLGKPICSERSLSADQTDRSTRINSTLSHTRFVDYFGLRESVCEWWIIYKEEANAGLAVSSSLESDQGGWAGSPMKGVATRAVPANSVSPSGFVTATTRDLVVLLAPFLRLCSGNARSAQ